MSKNYHLSMERGLPIEAVKAEEPKVPTIEEVMEITTEEQPQAQQELTQQEEQVQEVSLQPEQETPQARNFRQLREQKEKAERERDELARYLQEQLKKSQPQTQTDEEDDFNINPNDIVEGKHLKKYASEVKKLKQDLIKQQEQAKLASVKVQLQQEFPDFYKVVNPDALNNLHRMYPQLFNTLNANPDAYDAGISAYTVLKELKIYKEDLYEADRERIQKNAARPKTLASISPQKSESPLSHANSFANGLTEDLKKNLWKEMMEIRRKN